MGLGWGLLVSATRKANNGSARRTESLTTAGPLAGLIRALPSPQVLQTRSRRVRARRCSGVLLPPRGEEGCRARAIACTCRDKSSGIVVSSVACCCARPSQSCEDGPLRHPYVASLEADEIPLASKVFGQSGCGGNAQSSQLSAPPVRYSVGRVSKKFFSLRIETCSDIQGKRCSAPSYTRGSPMLLARWLAYHFAVSM